MNPPISQDDACKITLSYWEWDAGYSETAKNWNGILNSDVFQYPDLLGDSTPLTGSYYVDTGYFAYTGNYTMATSICANSTAKAYCDTELKRLLDVSQMTMTTPQIRNYITSLTTYTKWLPYIHGTIHAMIHHFVSFAMFTTSTAAMDPLFFMHHTNIDRFFHIWADCQGYDIIITDPALLNNNCSAYAQMNPIAVGSQPVADPYSKLVYPVDIDSTLNFYISVSSQAVFIPIAQWPTIRQMWSMGTATAPGWQGLYYRYGPDKMASILTSCTDQSWTWVNY